jgi:hypothetical protein
MIKYYGDNVRWFIGEVVDTSPPYGLEGRVRVRIHGVHNPSTRKVAQNDLPWAQCVLPTTEGGASGVGSTPKLESGSLVFGFFMDGKESQVPIVLGSLPRIELPSPVQKSLSFEDLLTRTDPNVDFYNQAVGSLNENDEALQNEVRDVTIDGTTAKYRRDTAVQFFLYNGYTLKQSCALVGGISKVVPSFNTTINNNGGVGLLGWDDVRFTRLKFFSNQWWHYSSQLAFILYELNTTHVDANIRILNSDVIDPSKGKALGDILRKYYMPIDNDYNGEVKKIYELYANKKV